VKDCTFTGVQSREDVWTRCQGTTYVGLVHVVIDKATNQTITSTSNYADQVTYLDKNGRTYIAALSDLATSGASILTRTDVNAAGTVTAIVTHRGSAS
jgi:hypothetical protein